MIKIIVSIFLGIFIFCVGGVFVGGGYYVALHLNYVAFGALIILFGGLLWVLPTMAWIFGSRKSVSPVLKKYQETSNADKSPRTRHTNHPKNRKNKRNKRKQRK